MVLKYKPDFERACKYWDAFWKKQIVDRPCIAVTAPKDGCIPSVKPPYPTLLYADYEAQANIFDKWAETHFFGGEDIPYWQLSFGPDQFSAFLGAELIQSKEGTSWVVPFVEDWEKIPQLDLKPNNAYWKEMLKALEITTKASKGKWLVSMLDFHSHLDCLLAIRGGSQLCMDLVDQPEVIEKVLKRIRKFFSQMYEAIYKVGDMVERGTIGWAPFYSKKRFATIQCDFIFLISPQMCRRFAIPAIAEEASYLDHCVYHLDGEGALRHLDDILDIPDIDVIQWVPGAGKPKHIEWMDLFKRIQKRGKGLEIHCSTEEVKIFHKELCPEGILYCVEASSEKEANDLIVWLKNNT